MSQESVWEKSTAKLSKTGREDKVCRKDVQDADAKVLKNMSCSFQFDETLQPWHPQSNTHSLALNMLQSGSSRNSPAKSIMYQWKQLYNLYAFSSLETEIRVQSKSGTYRMLSSEHWDFNDEVPDLVDLVARSSGNFTIDGVVSYMSRRSERSPVIWCEAHVSMITSVKFGLPDTSSVDSWDCWFCKRLINAEIWSDEAIVFPEKVLRAERVLLEQPRQRPP